MRGGHFERKRKRGHFEREREKERKRDGDRERERAHLIEITHMPGLLNLYKDQ